MIRFENIIFIIKDNNYEKKSFGILFNINNIKLF